MTPDDGLLLLIVLGVAVEVALAVWAGVEWWTRRERRRIDALHRCTPGCRCRGYAGRQRPG